MVAECELAATNRVLGSSRGMKPTESKPFSGRRTKEAWRRHRFLGTPELPLVTRILLVGLGWLLVLLGVAGLVLPGLQGILTLALGAAVLSLTSHVILRGLRWCFRPWPRAWRKLLRARTRFVDWLTRGREDEAP